MRLSEAQALSFDCYGTLIDWEAGLAAVLRPWARAAGLSLDDEALLAAFARHEGRAEEEHPEELYPVILTGALLGMGAEFGAPVAEADAARLARSVPDWPAFSDSATALAALAGRYQLIILSNVDRASFAGSAKRLGVTFTSVLTAQDIGSYKPSHRNFDALLAEARRLGVGQGTLLHVAQSLFHDHVPAKRAGLRTVWINRRRGRAGWGATPPPEADVSPDWEFGSMAEFADAVAADRLPALAHPVDAAAQGGPHCVGADNDRRRAGCPHRQGDVRSHVQVHDVAGTVPDVEPEPRHIACGISRGIVLEHNDRVLVPHDAPGRRSAAPGETAGNGCRAQRRRGRLSTHSAPRQ